MEKTDIGNNPDFMQPMGVKEGSVAQVTAQEMIRNLEEDVKSYTKVLEEAEKTLANYKEQVEVDKRVWELMLEPNAMRKLNPERGYELSDEYWALVHKKQEFKIKEDLAIIDGTIKRLENDVQYRKEALKNATEKLNKFKGE